MAVSRRGFLGFLSLGIVATSIPSTAFAGFMDLLGWGKKAPATTKHFIIHPIKTGQFKEVPKGTDEEIEQEATYIKKAEQFLEQIYTFADEYKQKTGKDCSEIKELVDRVVTINFIIADNLLEDRGMYAAFAEDLSQEGRLVALSPEILDHPDKPIAQSLAWHEMIHFAQSSFGIRKDYQSQQELTIIEREIEYHAHVQQVAYVVRRYEIEPSAPIEEIKEWVTENDIFTDDRAEDLTGVRDKTIIEKIETLYTRATEVYGKVLSEKGKKEAIKATYETFKGNTEYVYDYQKQDVIDGAEAFSQVYDRQAEAVLEYYQSIKGKLPETHPDDKKRIAKRLEKLWSIGFKQPVFAKGDPDHPINNYEIKSSEPKKTSPARISKKHPAQPFAERPDIVPPEYSRKGLFGRGRDKNGRTFWTRVIEAGRGNNQSQGRG